MTMNKLPEITDAERLQTELSLLEAIYPDHVSFTASSRDLTYRSPQGSLCLRLPLCYPSAALPDLISATGPQKQDLRTEMKDVVCAQAPGEEALDEIIARFIDIVSNLSEAQSAGGSTVSEEPLKGGGAVQEDTKPVKFLTVIVWLHHLLSTTKRKAVLSPPQSVPPVSGLSKPGYPGVLVFSGPEDAVREHVRELRGMRWQAFQVRLEEESDGDGKVNGVWEFGHGLGIKEVESMGAVVERIRGRRERELVVTCLGIK